MVLLHGFPEFWYSWRKQIPALVEAGFHVIAPDMRGYNLSDKPSSVRAYRSELLTRDVARLIDAFGAERATVIGHDWGAAVAWSFAMAYPGRLERLGILNVPHPLVFFRALRTARQLRKSWYVFFFQVPGLPEIMARARNYAFLRAAFRDSVLRGSFTIEDVERYIQAIGQPGALTAGINYYRALMRSGRGSLRRVRRIEQPVLVIWGERDRYLGKELAEPPVAWVPNARVERLPAASHWVHNDEPERVNQLLLDFLRASY